MTKYVTPLVAKLAGRLSVDLATVQGTGAGGRVTANDVRAGGHKPAPRPLAFAPAPSVAGGTSEERASVWNSQVTVSYDAYARNPLADDARQSKSDIYPAALRGGPPPTLFGNGDLPLFTASGLDPQLLFRVPWQARHPAARANMAEAQAIFAELLPDGTRDDAISKADQAGWTYGGDPGNGEYRARVQHWLIHSGL